MAVSPAFGSMTLQVNKRLKDLSMATQVRFFGVVFLVFFFFIWKLSAQQAYSVLVWRKKGVKVLWELVRVWTVGFSSTICVSCISWKEACWSVTCGYSMWMSLGFFFNFVDLIPQIPAVVLYKVEICFLETIVWYRRKICRALLGLCINCFPIAAVRKKI